MSDDDNAPVGFTLPDVADMMKESQFWSASKMQEYQRLQLSQLLLHAKSNTAFYKNRLDLVLQKDGTLNWNNWQQIPILRRNDLQNCRDAMRSASVPASHGVVGTSTSSGSSGLPIHISIPQLATWVSSTAWVRFLKHHGHNVNVGYTEFKAFLPSGQTMTEHLMKLPASSNRVPRIWINRNLSSDEKLDYLASTQTSTLVDTPNHVEVLAHENLRRAVPISLGMIIGIGMGITPAQEALFKRSFGAKTASPYSSKEGTLMAFQCSHERNNFHICSELVFFEVLNDRDQPAQQGEPGRVVITPFFNSAQPLIRYEQGDIVVRGGPCGCGSTLPVLSEIRGRSDAIFHFPDKRMAFNRFDDVLVQSSLKADAFQFAQISPTQIVVRYLAQSDASAANQARVREHLLFLLQTQVEITFARVQSIPFNPGGKQQRITREF